VKIRVALVVVELFLAVGALAGMVGLLSGGIRYPSSWLDGTPFPDYTIPALALGIVVGGLALAAAAAVLWAPAIAARLTLLSGLAIIAFELVEMAVLRFAPAALPFQLFYVAIGAIILGLAVRLRRSSDDARLRR
jgi:hypothetical protein